MKTNTMNSTPFWKKIHQTVSGHSHNITEDIVSEILKLSKAELVEGLLVYKPYSKKGYDEWVGVSNASNNMKDFVLELSEDLNLDASRAYPVMCNYLMFEYYGKIKEFWQITRIGTTVHLKENIWNFYTAERMFLLKTLRHVFEFVDRDYEFDQQYAEFINSLDLEKLQNNLIKQFECLLDEVMTKNLNEVSKRLENLLCRNSREQIEVLLILILTASHQPFKVTQLTNIINLFMQNNFNTLPVHFEITRFLKKQDFEELMCAEIGCFLVILESYWGKDLSDFWKKSSIIDLDKSLLRLHLNPGHSIIILTWLILKFKSVQHSADGSAIIELFKKTPFGLVHSITSNSIFKSCTAGDAVLKATHKMLDELCLMYDDRKGLYEEEGIIPTLAEFMREPELAEICLKTRNGLDSIVEIAIAAFPYDFFSLTAICHSLLQQPNQYKNTIHLLSNIPSFLSDMTWTVPKEAISVLNRSQPAFLNSDLIVFEPETTVRSYAIFGKNLIQYKGSFSYFWLLEYFVDLLMQSGLHEREFDEDLIKKVKAGYGIVIQIIKFGNMDLKVADVERCVNKLNAILIYLDGSLLRLDLVKLYFHVQVSVMIHRKTNFFENCPEIVWTVFFPKLKPECVTQDVAALLFNQYIFENTVFIKMFEEEEFQDDHALMLTYIDMLYHMLKVKLQFRNFQLSGVAYLFNCVFLQHQAWTYKEENQKSRITLGCLNVFHYILQQEMDELNGTEKKVFNLCQYAFLNNIFIIESFLKLFVKEKYHLIFLMERESNWISGPSLDKMHCIRMQLALLLIIMNQKKSIGRCNFTDRLSFVVKPVASYFTNAYSPVMAELSCRFLEKLAQDPYIPLLALLELDHYQVQSLFLERLRDPLEEENVKLAIIDLINTCIASQNGMTAAFFNLKCFMYWDGAESDVLSGDSVSDFMVDYLQNIKKSHEYFKNPLQLGILRLLNNLWLNHRENLIDNIANLKDFWPVMIDPFFCDFVQDIEVYTVILRVINLEIGANFDNVDEKLILTINNFLKDEDQLKLWIYFVLESSQVNAKNNLDLLSAWMEFLILTQKVIPGSFSNNVKIAIVDSCLDGLNSPLTGNVEIIYLWGQLYLMLISSWSVYENQENTIIYKLTKFLHSLNAFYKYLPPKVKEIVLCAIHKTIMDLEEYFTVNMTSLLTFLYSVGLIIDGEHDYLVTQVWNTEDPSEKLKRLKPWLLIIFIGNTILALAGINEVALWFSYRQFLQRVIDSVTPMLECNSTLPFAKIALNHLIIYAKSPLAKDFLNVQLSQFYYKIRPPVLTISVGEAILSGVPVNLKEWWLIFIALIRFNRVLIHNVGISILDSCLSFIEQNDRFLKEIIVLTKYTVDMTALTLVCETLQLVYAVMCLKPYWFVQSRYSYELIMEGVKTTMNAAILSILGYKKINFYNIIHGKDLDVINNAPTDLLVEVLNRLAEIIYWGSLCLKQSKPNLIKQLNGEFETEHVTLLVQNDFSVPRFELPITSKLTYGMLLCLADYLCKILNQLSQETPSSTNSATDLENIYEKCIGFMVYLQKSEDLANEKLSSFLHYDISEFASSSSSVISRLDYNVVRNSLEALMTFLAGEIFCTIRTLDGEMLFSYKRELSSEIQFFYEFVRKKTSEQYNLMITTPRSLSFPQSETDIVKRYMIAKTNDGDVYDVGDNNFVIVISQWLVKFCQLSN